MRLKILFCIVLILLSVFAYSDIAPDDPAIDPDDLAFDETTDMNQSQDTNNTSEIEVPVENTPNNGNTNNTENNQISDTLNCDIACDSDADCDDGLGNTIDSCITPSTCNSKCMNTLCNITCSSKTGCDDGNPLTSDTCNNSGTCSSSCENKPCNPRCESNSDCSDGDSLTTDVCAGAGRCTATCENLTSCGDGTCDDSESKCSCPSDCGTCSESISSIFEMTCIGNSCKQMLKAGVCGNDRCETSSGENYFTCNQDCEPLNVKLEFNLTDAYYVRGETVPVKVTALIDGAEVNDLKLRAEGFFGDIPIFNDGKHDDGKRTDNIYNSSFLIPVNIQQKLYPVIVYAEIEGKNYKNAQMINVSPRLDLSLFFSKKFYVLGDNLLLEGSISRKGTPLEENFFVEFRHNNETIEKIDVNSVSGKFTAEYRTTLIDSAGVYSAFIHIEDENSNSVEKEIEVEVLSPDATNFLNVESFDTEKDSYVKGEEANFIVKVTDISGNPVPNAQVKGTVSTGQQIIFSELDGGIYTGIFIIPQNISDKNLTIIVDALSQNRQGTTQIEFGVISTNINISITQPKKGVVFQLGEEISIIVKAVYDTNAPLVTGKVIARINGAEIDLIPTEKKGVYSGVYILRNESEGNLEIEFEANSGYGDTGREIAEIQISGISYQYYLREYGLSLGLLFFALVLSIILTYVTIRVKGKEWLLKRKKKELAEKIKGIQTQYFVEGSIDKKSYNEYMEKYGPEINEVEESLRVLKGKK